MALTVADSFSISSKRIYIQQGITSFDPVELYRDVREARRLEIDDLHKVDNPLSMFGNIDKGGGKATPRYALLNNGWKIVAFDEDSEITITGEMITDDQTSIFDNSTLTSSVIWILAPADAEIIYIEIDSPIKDSLDYNDLVTIDIIDGSSGTSHPIGTSIVPSNNLIDSLIIHDTYGLNGIKVKGNLPLSTNDISNKHFIGSFLVTSIIDVQGGTTSHTRFSEMTVTGNLNGTSTMKECLVSNVTNFSGSIFNSLFLNNISIDSSVTDLILIRNCSSSVAGSNILYDHNSSPSDINFRNWTGSVSISNFNQGGNASFDLTSGKVVLENSCTSGVVVCRGVGRLVDINGDDIKTGTWNNITIVNETINRVSIEELRVINDNVKNSSLLIPATKSI